MAMSVSQMTQYRREHPDYYEAEKAKNNARCANKYASDEEYRLKRLEYARQYYSIPEHREARNALKREYRRRAKLAKQSALQVE